MAKPSSQKFIARNRAPRVQIEYDVELYGAQKKVQVPFVMGVMADLSGDSKEPLPGVEERKFLAIDIDNFDERMKAMKPRAAFTNTTMATTLSSGRRKEVGPSGAPNSRIWANNVLAST